MKTNKAIFAFAALLGLGMLSGKAEATCRYQCTDMGINHSKPLLSYFSAQNEDSAQYQAMNVEQSASNGSKSHHIKSKKAVNSQPDQTASMN